MKIYVKHIIIYGSILAGISISVKCLELLFFSNIISVQFFLAICAIIFLVLGFWMGIKPSTGNNKSFIREVNSNDILSKRETEILDLISQGMTNKQISDRLFISLNTTKSHISNIYSKLNTKNRVQAVESARKLDII